jgi:hypothetical protein
VETFFFPIGQSSMDSTSLPMEKFSSQGMKLWEKYFAPHIHQFRDNSQKLLEIPINFFNFITVMLLTPENFDWTKKFINLALHKNMLENGETEDYVSFIMQQAPSYKVREL